MLNWTPMPSPLDHALGAGVSRAGAEAPGRSALALGTVGRVGEELLNCLLESPNYQRVHVLVEAPMRSMMSRLQPWQVSPTAMQDVAANATAPALPCVDDVFCCISDARSHFKRDQAYVMVDRSHIVALARAARASGARRFVLLAPLSAFLQLTSSSTGPIDVHESDLVSAGFASLIIVRPTADYAAPQGNVIERAIAWGAKAVMQIMTPPKLQPLRARKIAQAAVNAASLLGAGTHIVGAEAIAQLASPGEPVQLKRRRF
jgi:hypothetical protein